MDLYDKHRNKPTDPGFFDEAEIVYREWHEQHEPGYWSGTVVAHLGREAFTISVFGDPDGNAFREIEEITDWEVSDCLD